jgi:hypothetical protein
MVFLLTVIEDMHNCVKYTETANEITGELMVVYVMVEWQINCISVRS